MDKTKFLKELLSNNFTITRISNNILSEIEKNDYIIYEGVLNNLLNSNDNGIKDVYLITDIKENLDKTRIFSLSKIFGLYDHNANISLNNIDTYFVLKYKLNLNNFFPDE